MKKLTLVLSDDVEQDFRKLAAHAHGLNKGSLSKAGEEAITLWIRRTLKGVGQKKKDKEEQP